MAGAKPPNFSAASGRLEPQPAKTWHQRLDVRRLAPQFKGVQRPSRDHANWVQGRILQSRILTRFPSKVISRVSLDGTTLTLNFRGPGGSSFEPLSS